MGGVYEDYKPAPYTFNTDPASPSYPFRPVEGQGVYLDGDEIAYKEIWNGEDLQIKRKNDYMRAMAEKQAMERKMINEAQALNYLSKNPVGPLGLREDIRIPSREAAAWYK
jgi:hypothetical protein